MHHAGSYVRLDESPELLTLVGLDPKAILQGATPRLIDEWQLAPEVWNVIRHEIDDRQLKASSFCLGQPLRPTTCADTRESVGSGG